ncbi:MAG TPA: hypothetical protein DCO75_04565 [Fibrobacteres bacterium]|nr:hypothetical protein [Fibrobacterota bacterium]
MHRITGHYVNLTSGMLKIGPAYIMQVMQRTPVDPGGHTVAAAFSSLISENVGQLRGRRNSVRA